MKNISSTTKFDIYLSYPFNREDRDNFSRELHRYASIGVEIAAYLIDWEKLHGYPKLGLYVPADYELFINCAYRHGLITQTEIDFIHHEIIKLCILLISFGDKPVLADIEIAKQNQTAIYTMPNFSPAAIDALKQSIEYILKR